MFVSWNWIWCFFPLATYRLQVANCDTHARKHAFFVVYTPWKLTSNTIDEGLEDGFNHVVLIFCKCMDFRVSCSFFGVQRCNHSLFSILFWTSFHETIAAEKLSTLPAFHFWHRILSRFSPKGWMSPWVHGGSTDPGCDPRMLWIGITNTIYVFISMYLNNETYKRCLNKEYYI